MPSPSAPVQNIDAPPIPISRTLRSRIARHFAALFSIVFHHVHHVLQYPITFLNQYLSKLVASTSPSLLSSSPSIGRLDKKTLILDLDETLVHAANKSWEYRRVNANAAGSMQINVSIDGLVTTYYVAKRPHVDYFLHKVTQWYKVVVFTASLPEYADPVISWLDPRRKYFAGRYFRSACIPRGASFVKNVSVVEPDLRRVMLVDNSVVAYAMHQENGIPIASWLDDEQDEALLELLPVLDALRFVQDVRSILSLKTIHHHNKQQR